MGFDINGIKLLIESKKLNINFEKTLMIGRQEIHAEEKSVRKILKTVSLNIHKYQHHKYAENLLAFLGSKQTDSIDINDFEGATIIHDLNVPINDALKNKYSLVIDGGSLEHVFNFPIAIKNCMELVKENGYFIGISPSNNFFGHGFYQFSPELYFRIFSEENGFKIVKIFLYLDKESTPIYEVVDPMIVRERVILSNSLPTYLFVIAKKTTNRTPFETPIYQSDYQNIIWTDCPSQKRRDNKRIYFFLRIFPNHFKTRVKKLFKKTLFILKIYRNIGTANPKYIKITKI